MRLLIVGAGVVGQATGKTFTRWGHDVAYSDSEPYKVEKCKLPAWDRECDRQPVFCVPEVVIHEAVESYFAWHPVGVFRNIIVRSSVPPGTCELIARKYGCDVLHNPEFLKEVTAEDDVIEAKYTLLGVGPDTPDSYGFTDYAGIYSDMNVDVHWLSWSETELIKLITNSYLATLISFWNEVGKMCEVRGLNSHKIARYCTLDPRVVTYGAYKHGQAYGGKCLPKDVKQLIEYGSVLGSAMNLLRSVEWVNDDVKNAN